MSAAKGLSIDVAEKRPHLFLVDGYSFVFRAYHSLPPLTRGDGTAVGAVYGFTNMLLKVKEKAENHDHHYLAVVFDAGAKTFRNEMYEEYKANRPEAPEDLKVQFPLVHDATSALNIPWVKKEGFEADDIIATYAKQAEAEGYKVTIISSDKDLMQLVSENVEMFDTMKNKRIGIEQVKEKFGVEPERVLDVLSLIGDSSDNVPGVPGIGPKTAAELINTFGDLDSVLERAEEIKQNKRRENLIEFADQARLSRDLIRLKEDVELEETYSEFQVRDEDPETLLAFLKENNFATLISRLSKKSGVEVIKDVKPASELPKLNITEADDTAKVEAWLKSQTNALEMAVELQKDKNGNPTTLALATAQNTACVLKPKADAAAAQGSFDFESDTSFNWSTVFETLAKYFAQPHMSLITADVKFLFHQMGTQSTAYDDIALMHYVLFGASKKHDLATMAETILDIHFAEDEEAETLANRASSLLLLKAQLLQQLQQHQQLNLYFTMERPLLGILFEMEKAGIEVDKSQLQGLSKTFTEEMEKLEKEIYSLAGHEFNIGSPKQLGEVLFEEMDIKGGKKSKKSGAYSTDADVLEKLSVEGHTIAEKVLQWRGLSKLRSTYTEALQHQIRGDNRVHTTFDQMLTSTGRLSSRDPNVQNIPVRDERGALIRKAFVAKDGYELVSADYSQIELRLLADLAQIDALKEAFNSGTDIHATTAAQVFGMKVEDVDSSTRRSAKAINFGIIYGQSAFGLAKSLGISRTEAKEYIEAYFAQYPGIRKYMDRTKELAHEQGFVETLFGRRCYLPGINDKNPARRQFAERAAINAPLQGTAADIIKKAMVSLAPKLEEKFPKADLLLQVHDELIVEVPKADAAAVAKLIEDTMQQAVSLSVPIIAEANVGSNWGDIH